MTKEERTNAIKFQEAIHSIEEVFIEEADRGKRELLEELLAYIDHHTDIKDVYRFIKIQKDVLHQRHDALHPKV